MNIRNLASGKDVKISIDILQDLDWGLITKNRFFFDWKKLAKTSQIFKLRIKGDNDIKGLMAIIDHREEMRIEVKLLAVSRENVKLKSKKEKEYEGIAGNLLAFACKLAVQKYGEYACVSLVPKTELKQHYIKQYGMLDAGLSLFLELTALHRLIIKYGI